MTVYIPALKAEHDLRRNDFYRQIGVTGNFLPLDTVGKHQLPVMLLIANGAFVERPESWKKRV